MQTKQLRYCCPCCGYPLTARNYKGYWRVYCKYQYNGGHYGTNALPKRGYRTLTHLKYAVRQNLKRWLGLYSNHCGATLANHASNPQGMLIGHCYSTGCYKPCRLNYHRVTRPYYQTKHKG